MKRIEIIAGISFVLAAILKIFNISGIGIAFVFIGLILSALYYVFSFAIFNNIEFGGIFKKSSYSNTNIFKIIVSIFMGWALSVLLTGILFKFQLWPGNKFILSAGLISTLIILFISTLSLILKKDSFFKRLFVRGIIFSLLGFLIFIFPQEKLIDIYYRNNPHFAEIYKRVLKNPEDTLLQKEFEEARQEIISKKD